MLKFIRSKGNQQPSAERQKLQKELYAFRKVSRRFATSFDAPCRRSGFEFSPKLDFPGYVVEKYLTRLHYKLFYLYTKHISYQQRTPTKKTTLKLLFLLLFN